MVKIIHISVKIRWVPIYGELNEIEGPRLLESGSHVVLKLWTNKYMCDIEMFTLAYTPFFRH